VTEIGFYHLTRTGCDQALPQLLARTLAAGQRAVVLCSSTDQVAALDETLWQCSRPDWLPHGSATDGDPHLQPVWLTVDDSAPNGARFLFLIDGTRSARLGEFSRVFDLFDGNDEAAVSAARDRWMEERAAGHTLTYWQQGARGWERKG
jgi:DNA polymerase-3 subunit chi